jgi:hypothetical protein
LQFEERASFVADNRIHSRRVQNKTYRHEYRLRFDWWPGQTANYVTSNRPEEATPGMNGVGITGMFSIGRQALICWLLMI